MSIESIREREAEARDAAITETQCMWCEDWTFSGTAAECREAARKHREKEHPGVIQPSRLHVKKSQGWRQPGLTGEDYEAVENERRKRMYLLGIGGND